MLSFKRKKQTSKNVADTTFKAGFLQGSILAPLFFLIYIDDLSESLKSTVKLFADDTLIFHVVKDPNTSAEIFKP